MDLDHFTPIASTVGGVLIGLAAAFLLLLTGRIAGVSGITSGLLAPKKGDIAWRASFVGGLIAGGLALRWLMPSASGWELSLSPPIVVTAGLLVGFGTHLGRGCTSGHGICGLSRLSPRSLVATGCFMAAGMATAFLSRHVLGGSP